MNSMNMWVDYVYTISDELQTKSKMFLKDKEDVEG